MSQPERTDPVEELLERLLVDADFRAAFRRDPVGGCLAFNLPELAREMYDRGRGMATLEIRESKSSLAGFLMAAAAEGMGIVELAAHLRGDSALAAPARAQLTGVIQRVGAHPPAPPAGAGAGPALDGPQPVGRLAPAPDAPPVEPARGAVGTAAGMARAADAPGNRAGSFAAVRVEDIRQRGAVGAVRTEDAAGAPQRVGVDQAAPSPTASPDYPAGAPIGQGPGGLPFYDPVGGAQSSLIGHINEGTHSPSINDNWQSTAAVDISIPEGTPIYATFDGTLGNTGELGSGGRFAGIRINLETQPGGPAVYYAHLSKLAPGIEKGAAVRAGQLLGWSGSANGVPHLHFAMGTTGDSSVSAGMDPEPYIEGTPPGQAPAAAPAAGAPAPAPAPGTPAPPAPTPPDPAAGAPTPAAPAATPPAEAAEPAPPAPYAARPRTQLLSAVHVAAEAAAGPSVAEAAGPPLGAEAVADAKSFLGTPYLWGGTTPSGFDCSGLLQYVYAKLEIQIPRVAEDQATAGVAVPDMSQLRAGDLVYFADSGGYIHHIGMYIGNHQFIHAPHTGDVVKISSLDEPYYKGQYAGGRRVAPEGPPAATPAAPVPVDPRRVGDAAGPPVRAAGSHTVAPRAVEPAQPAPGTPPADPSQPAPGPTPPADGTVPASPDAVPLPTGDAAQYRAAVESYLAGHQTTMTADDFMVAVNNGVDPRYVAAVAEAESSFGTAGYALTSHNAFGYGVHLGYKYASWGEGVDAMTKGLAGPLYKGSGLTTIRAIAERYAPRSENDTDRYVANIQRAYAAMGGNPEGSVFLADPAAAPAAPAPPTG